MKEKERMDQVKHFQNQQFNKSFDTMFFGIFTLLLLGFALCVWVYILITF